jgi:heterodisulfide reductase subunit A-like polyferredoxin
MAPHSEHSPDFEIPHESVSIDVPVLVVGGGPTGLLEAHMLSKLGGLELIIPQTEKLLKKNSQISRYRKIP